MFILLMTFVSVLAFSEAVDYVNELHTNCTGLENCFKQQTELLQKLLNDYLLAAKRVKEKVKLCLDSGKPYACVKEKNDTCPISDAELFFETIRSHVQYFCDKLDDILKKNEAVDYVKEYHTNCTGLENCIRQQAKLEQLEMEYMSAVHDKEKYDKLCLDLEKPFACYKKMNDTCRIDQLDLAFQRTRLNLQNMCDVYGEKFKQKDADTVLKKSDSNCTEVVQCLIQLVKMEKICVNSFNTFTDENCYKNLCTNSQKLRSCFEKKKGKCEVNPMEIWIDNHKSIYQLFCVNNGSQFNDQIWHVIKKGCPRDKCFNDLRNIDLAEVMNVTSSNDLAKKKDFCQKREIFKKCEEKFEHYCLIIDREPVDKRIKLLEELVCSKEEEDYIAREAVCDKLYQCSREEDNRIDEILNLEYSRLLNKTTYDEICKMKDKKYDCYLKKQKENNCAIDDITFNYKKRKLVAEFVCSDEGRKGIEAMRNSPCFKSELQIHARSESTYQNECRWWAIGLGTPCPFINRFGACIADKLHKEEGCGPALSSFYNKIFDITNSNFKCNKDSELEAKDRFLYFP